MPTENENVVPQAEENAMSTKDMLIQALENAQNDSAPDVQEAPQQPIVENPAENPMENPMENHAPQPVMADAITEQPAMQNQLYTREDVIDAIKSVTPQTLETPVAEEVTVTEEVLPDFNSEEFMNEFYDNPASAVEKAANVIAEKKVKEVVSGIEKKLQPLLSQSEAAQLRDEVRAKVGDFLEHTDDARDLFPDMASYIKQNNLDPRSNQTYLDAYRVSKINRLGAENEKLRANQGKGLGDYLADENSLNEIAKNEIVRQKVIDEYLNGLNNGEKPRTISSNGTNQPSAQPVNKASTMKDAKAMLLAQLQG